MEFTRLCHLHYLIIFLSHVLFSSSSSLSLSLNASLLHLCLDDQRSALLQFMNESLSESDPKLSSWKPHTDCCSWEGITCDKATGHVISLHLRSRGLVGRIDSKSSLFKLHTLLSLDLSENLNLIFKFSSENDKVPIPFGFSQLSGLTYLSISYTAFSGQIPLQMSRLTKLVSLDLSFNMGQPKLETPNLERLIQNMSSLRLLYLDGVDMSTHNSNWCDALSSAVPNLVELSLSSCLISGPIHSSLSNLHFLSEIYLSGNSLFSEVPESLLNMSSLVSIHLHGCELHGEFPTNVFKLPNLQEIDVSQNPDLLGHLPEFPHRSALRYLGITETGFHGNIPESIGNLELLVVLDLNSLNFSGPIPSSIGNLRKLQILDLSFNHFNDSIPSSIGKLAQMTNLDLSSNHFHGSIPSSIVNCRQLQYLFLSSNNFSGQIPHSIVNLTALEILDLSSNHFSGSIPSLILPGNITSKFEEHPSLSPDSGLLSLIFLDLSENSLDGIISHSLFTLPSLVNLDLRDNILQWPIPGRIAHFTSLTMIDLSSNEFNTSMDLDVLSNLTNLRELYLFDNHWSITASPNLTFPQLATFVSYSCSAVEFPTFLRNLPNLVHLDMSNNRIKGQIPSWIWTSSLGFLNLSSNLLTGLDRPFPNASTLQNLGILDLHSNNLQGSLPPLSSLAGYQDYSNNSFTSFIPDNIGSQISGAVFFSVSGNTLAGKIPTSICNASYLEVLDLSDNNLNGTIPSCLGNFSSSLSVLNLGGNGLKGTMPKIFAESLTTLVFNGNQLEGKVPSSLYGCQKLEVLDLGNNRINDTFPFRLQSLPQLRVLVLRSNGFYGQIKHSKTRNAFPVLHVIDLSSNGFTGQLPSKYFHTWKAMMKAEDDKSGPNYLGVRGFYYEFRSSINVTMKGGKFQLERILDVFTSIDLSNNQFEGKIPERIGELKSLHVLDLSSNNLDGPIPSSMENLHQLESLDLSNNKLSGQIPVQLTRLTFLSFLDLARNNLKGAIPTGGQFNTFPPKSYEGNPMLCGFPLSKKCRVGEEAKPPAHQGVPLDSDSRIHFDWTVAWMGYGCGVVAGLSIGYILFWGNGVFAESIPIKRQHRRSTRRQRRRRT